MFSGIQLFHLINDCFPASSLYSSGMPTLTRPVFMLMNL